MVLGPGVFPAAVTPFDVKGEVGVPDMVRLFSWFRAGGCKGVVLAGTNGEGPSLSAVEKRDLVREVMPFADGLKVILAVATASLPEAAWLCRQAAQARASAALVMPPAYFREASAQGLTDWYRALLDQARLPVLAYNFPQRTGIPLTAEFLHGLADHELFLGAKDSSGDASNLVPYAQALPGKELYVGAEPLLGAALVAGWMGTISGAANVMPRWLVQVVDEWETNRESAETKLELLQPALAALRSVPQPAGNKGMLERMGVLANRAVRLPLNEISPQSLDALWAEVGRFAQA